MCKKVPVFVYNVRIFNPLKVKKRENQIIRSTVQWWYCSCRVLFMHDTAHYYYSLTWM